VGAANATASHADGRAASLYAFGPMTDDTFAEALDLVRAAQRERTTLRLVGGLAVRALCPSFPPRTHDRQDLDLASTSAERAAVTAFLAGRGFRPDDGFNQIHGHKQLYFRSPAGRSVDVLIDRLEMCHVLDFRDRLDRMPLTLDVTDLLLTKLQIVELNEKDAADAIQLLAAYPVRAGDEPGTIGLARFGQVVADDWGWWRTVTGNLDRIRSLAAADGGSLVPPGAAFDPVEQLDALRAEAERVPKSRRWRLRSLIGERVRWYELPEVEPHD
jgi:hypothetical protein